MDTPELTFADVIAAYKKGPKAVNEVSLARVYQHVQRAGTKSFAILTAWLQGRSKQDNLREMADLVAKLRKQNLGFFKLRGAWQECQDKEVAYKDCPPDKLVDASEPSLFIPGITLAATLYYLRRYEQNAVIYSGPETKGDVTLFFPGGHSAPLGKFSPSKIAANYSKLRGHPFTFECVAQTDAEKALYREFRAAGVAAHKPLTESIKPSTRLLAEFQLLAGVAPTEEDDF